MSNGNFALEFTGERFTPECVREIWYEHFHRYAFALPLAEGKRVLDAACGEGYGSALLATRAAAVLGLDISSDATAHAAVRYARSRPNLSFQVEDVSALEAMPDASFDLICIPKSILWRNIVSFCVYLLDKTIKIPIFISFYLTSLWS